MKVYFIPFISIATKLGDRPRKDSFNLCRHAVSTGGGDGGETSERREREGRSNYYGSIQSWPLQQQNRPLPYKQECPTDRTTKG